MTTNRIRESATIYHFPAGGRAGLEARREVHRPVAKPPAQTSAVMVTGNSWYHDEAVREAEKARKR